ncbi:transposable element Tc3 transposase [Trichonephila clavipes]|uniref:Transposable element Tc3 transposase n=1 Tax=Trichonephila clavipes TaxID=2585209 RepID=A0A8X6VPR2_TRICX|nr:transposable element Tc3 transposase [Trichonephila clavipes]
MDTNLVTSWTRRTMAPETCSVKRALHSPFTDCPTGTVTFNWVAGGINGPYFYKNDEGHNLTVNGDWYRAMITNFFIPELNNHDVQELWFHQEGATCHTARATIDLLKDTFGNRLISRFGPVNWPPRSCDLTPLYYFLWSYVKSLVYADKPQTLDHLEDNIRRVIADIRPQMLEKVIENWTSTLDYIRARRGSPMPEIIFKM